MFFMALFPNCFIRLCDTEWILLASSMVSQYIIQTEFGSICTLLMGSHFPRNALFLFLAALKHRPDKRVAQSSVCGELCSNRGAKAEFQSEYIASLAAAGYQTLV